MNDPDLSARLPPHQVATLQQWLSHHPDPAYASRLDHDLELLASHDGGAAWLDAAAQVAALRKSGHLLFPAFRTSEWLAWHALGATDLDPTTHGIRLGAGNPFATPAAPRWYAARPHPQLPTATAWQLVAAERIWPDGPRPGLGSFTPETAALVVAHWPDLTPGHPRPLTTPKSLPELAAQHVLASPIGESRGLWARFNGLMRNLRPSQHLLFEQTRGWPVFADDVERWLLEVGGLDLDHARKILHELRISALVSSVPVLPRTCAPLAELLVEFGPRMMPRSVAFAEATLSLVGARTLDQAPLVARECRDADAGSPPSQRHEPKENPR